MCCLNKREATAEEREWVKWRESRRQIERRTTESEQIIGTFLERKREAVSENFRTERWKEAAIKKPNDSKRRQKKPAMNSINFRFYVIVVVRSKFVLFNRKHFVVSSLHLRQPNNAQRRAIRNIKIFHCDARRNGIGFVLFFSLLLVYCRVSYKTKTMVPPDSRLSRPTNPIRTRSWSIFL